MQTEHVIRILVSLCLIRLCSRVTLKIVIKNSVISGIMCRLSANGDFQSTITLNDAIIVEFNIAWEVCY